MLINRSFGRLRSTILFFASATTIVVLQDHPQSAQAQQAATSDHGFSKEKILNWLEGKKQDRNKFNEMTLIGLIGKEGISFKPTQDDKDAIRQKGGSAKLIAAIETAKFRPERPVVPPPPPPPPPKKTGTLTVSCQPAECLVSLNGKAPAPTHDGVYSTSLDEGSATVSVTKDDYEPDQKQKVVDVQAAKPGRVDFTFKVSAAALAKVGQRLFDQMMAALGGPVGLKATEILRGKGTLKSYTDGKVTEWDIVALVELPNKGKFNLTGSGQKLDATRTNDGFDWRKSRSPVGVGEIEACLRWLEDYQISAMVGRMTGGAFKMTAEQLTRVEGQPLVLRAKGASEGYKISLDQEFRPQEIVLESPGLDSGLRIMYSEYTTSGKSVYPTHIQVILPDSARHGVEVRFSQVDLNLAPGVASAKK